MALTRYPTAGSVINDAARDLGLGTVADPFASTDANFQQLVGLLTNLGQSLAREHTFRQLIVYVTLTKSGGVWTVLSGFTANSPGVDDLLVPPDFVGLLDQSSWNQSTRLPIGGPLTPQLWEYRKSSPVGSIFAEFRTETNVLRFLPTPLGDYTIVLEYKSRAWVSPAAQGVGLGNTLGPNGADAPVAFGDIVLFDRLLALAGLKLYWKRERGLDTGAAEAEFERELSNSTQNQSSARVLGMTGPKANPHLIDIMNLPDTGFGR